MQTVQDLIDMLNEVEDKSTSIVLGLDGHAFYSMSCSDITLRKAPYNVLVLEATTKTRM